MQPFRFDLSWSYRSEFFLTASKIQKPVPPQGFGVRVRTSVVAALPSG